MRVNEIHGGTETGRMSIHDCNIVESRHVVLVQV